MKRSFNYTDRKEIPAGQVIIRLHRGNASGELPRFSAELDGLSQLGLDPAAKVYVEPYVSAGTTMRFPFGSVGALQAPDDTVLGDLDAGASILFRVKVVDESRDPCPIMASANQLRPLEEKEELDDRRAILPVRETADLGEALWEIDIQPQAGPELLINNGIPAFLERLKTDPLVQGFILPHALRSILKFVFLNDEINDDEPWVESWRQFAEEIVGAAPPDPDEDAEEEETNDFIEKCVHSFCERQQFTTMARRLIAGGEDA